MTPPNATSAPVGAKSATWDHAGASRISVHVPCYRRADLLPALFASLESQTLSYREFEVVAVDDASDDDTWQVLCELVRRSPLRALALRMDTNAGPATARNRAVATSSAPVIAFTDDDCLPTPVWLAGLLDAMEPDVAVIQGRVTPPPSEWADAGPWDHTIWVNRRSPFFETCNVAYRREDFARVGGFDVADPLLRPAKGDHFGEDAVLAWRVLRDGGRRAFAEDALVYHRCLPRTFRAHIRAQRRVARFPGLARRSPIFAEWLARGLFLSRRSAAFDGAVLATLAGVTTRRTVFLAGALPWTWMVAKEAAHRSRGRKARSMLVALGIGVTDLVTFVSLVEGSIRYRRPIL